MIRALMMATFGLIIGTMGLDNISGWLVSPSTSPSCSMASVLSRGHGPLRHLRSPAQHRDENQAGNIHDQVKGLLPTLQDWGMSIGAILRGTVSGSSWAFSREEGLSLPLLSLMRLKKEFPNIRKNSGRAPSREWRLRSPPTTPRPRGPLFPCSPSNPFQRRHGDAFRRPDHPRVTPAPPPFPAPQLFWGVSPACTSATSCFSFSTSR